MIPRIADMRYIEDFRIWLRFEDGREGEIDLSGELWGEVFEPLRELRKFKQVQLDRELNTVRWESGADFAPELLYDNLTSRGA
jgi:hypothetical protein